MDSYSILQDKINTAKLACIEEKKRQLKYFFRSRKHFEPECKKQAEDQYRAELDKQQANAIARSEALDSEFMKEIGTSTSTNLVKPLLILGAIAVLIYIFFL